MLKSVPVEITNPILPSEGINKATVHVYVRTERVAFINADGSMGGLGSARIFRCTETNAERRWGMDA